MAMCTDCWMLNGAIEEGTEGLPTSQWRVEDSLTTARMRVLINCCIQVCLHTLPPHRTCLSMPPPRLTFPVGAVPSPRSHTKVAMEKPQKELYIRSTVAEILHEMCLDSEVPRAQRKFERRKMSRCGIIYGLLTVPPVEVVLRSATFLARQMK